MSYENPEMLTWPAAGQRPALVPASTGPNCSLRKIPLLACALPLCAAPLRAQPTINDATSTWLSLIAVLNPSTLLLAMAGLLFVAFRALRNRLTRKSAFVGVGIAAAFASQATAQSTTVNGSFHISTAAAQYLATLADGLEVDATKVKLSDPKVNYLQVAPKLRQIDHFYRTNGGSSDPALSGLVGYVALDSSDTPLFAGRFLPNSTPPPQGTFALVDPTDGSTEPEPTRSSRSMVSCSPLLVCGNCLTELHFPLLFR